MKKWLSLFLVFAVVLLFTGAPIADAKGSSSFSSGAKSSTSSFSGSSFKSSTTTSSPSTSTSGTGSVSGYKSTAPAGSTTTTKDGSTVTSGGGTVSGYNSAPGSTNNLAPKATANTQTQQAANKPSSSDSSYSSGSYRSGGSGLTGFFGGLALGSLLTMPSYGHGGYYGGGGYAPSGFGFLGWILWLISWIVVLGIIGGVAHYCWRRYNLKEKINVYKRKL